MQEKNLDKNESIGVSYLKAAEIAKVSVVTIRNWVKTGYLLEQNKGLIERKSLVKFMNEIAGKEKLNSRANKLQKDEHDHEKLSNEINKKLNASEVNSEIIGEEYEISLSNSYRNKEGVYYTPNEIVNDMLANIEIDEFTTFCDPSCGSGNFLIEAINKGIKPENIYGFDIDANAVAISKKRIFDKTGHESENIIITDFLEFSSSDNYKKLSFDMIFTNPPWGKKLPKKIKEKYGKIFNSGKSLDTSSLFFFASLKILKNGGILGFLLPEAFFNIATFQDAREVALKYNIDRLVDYGKSFKGLLTKAQAIILTKVLPKDDYDIICETNKMSFLRNRYSFENNPKKIFNFNVNTESSKIIKHVYKLPHITLANKAKWALGIVTGNNSKYCSAEYQNGHIPVFKGADIKPNELKKPSNFIPDDFSLYQQVAPLDLYRSPVKLIYKFISSNLVFFHDTKQRFVLNSANILVLEDEDMISSKQLCDLLNSEFMNWLFRNIFNTHKILRNDIETLPIHTDYFKKYSEFNEKQYLEYLNVEKDENGIYRIKTQ